MMLLPLYVAPPVQATPIKTYAEGRERFERRINRDFNDSANDNRSDLLSRWRVGAKFELVKGWTGELQYQLSQTTSWSQARNFSFEDSNASLGYLQGKVEDWSLTVGRQKVVVGQQRLIGAGEWSNVGRSFDGVRARKGKWDLLGAGVGVSSPRPRYARVGMALYGDTNRYTALIHKHDEVSGADVDLFTLNHFERRKLGPVTLQFEGAAQGGDNAGKDHEAWAVHARASYPAGSTTTLFVEGNAASGGSDPDKVKTFDQLYATNHDKYGIADMVGWRNMGELAIGVEFQPVKDGLLKVSYRKFGLNDGKDGWYGDSGAPVRVGGVLMRDATGASGRDLGSEIDLDASYTISKTFSLQFGVAFFEPGKFVKSFGNEDRQTWGYISINGKF